MNIIGILWLIIILTVALIAVLTTILVKIENNYRESVGRPKLSFRRFFIGMGLGAIFASLFGVGS